MRSTKAIKTKVLLIFHNLLKVEGEATTLSVICTLMVDFCRSGHKYYYSNSITRFSI